MESPTSAEEIRASYTEVAQAHREVADLPAGRSRTGWVSSRLRSADPDNVGFATDNDSTADDSFSVDPTLTPERKAEQMLAAVPAMLQQVEVVAAVAESVVDESSMPSEPARRRVRDWFDADLKADAEEVVIAAAVAGVRAARRVNVDVKVPLAVAAVYLGCHAAKAAYHAATGKSAIGQILAHVSDGISAVVGTAIS